METTKKYRTWKCEQDPFKRVFVHDLLYHGLEQTSCDEINGFSSYICSGQIDNDKNL